MSVRNHYARNYTKVSPFPPSNKFIVEAKAASRKADNLKTHVEKKAKTEREAMKVEKAKKVEVLDKHALDNMARKPRPGVEQGNTEHHTHITHVHKTKSDVRSDSKLQGETVHTTNGCEILQIWTNEQEQLDKVVKNERDTSVNSQQSQHGQITDSKPDRPKSARPESRWERRATDTVFETSERQQTKPTRPKSARPESRMLRMMEAQAQSEFTGMDDLPPRPRTAYGRRRGSGADSEVSITTSERPISRIGKYSHNRSPDNDDREPQPKNRDKKSKRQHNADRVHSGGRRKRDGESGGVFSTSPQENYGRWRSKTVLDLNSGIDDIDLDVDPVLYFMQDDSSPAKPAHTRHSLSKDAIDFIGNSRSHQQDKAPIGYHDNYLDKHHYATGKQDRFHGNKVNSVQNSILDDDRFSLNNARRGRIGNDPFVRDKIRYHQSGEPLYTDSFQESYNYLKLPSRPREILNECRGQHPPPDGAVNGRLGGHGNGAGDNRTAAAAASYRRHPRKLQPISAAFNINP